MAGDVSVAQSGRAAASGGGASEHASAAPGRSTLSGADPADGAEHPAVAAALAGAGGGAPIEDATRAKMEQKLGARFANVRIHVGGTAAAAARAISARAFTAGHHIFFSDGAYAPGSPAGDKLLAHELMHVVQAQQGRTGGKRVSQPDESLEHEADAAADSDLNAARASATSTLGATPSLESSPLLRKAADVPPSPMDFGEGSRSVGKLGRVSASKGIYLKQRPTPDGPKAYGAIVPFNARVFVVSETLGKDSADRWCYLAATDIGASGFIEERFVAMDPPDAQSKLHQVTGGETLGKIARDAFGKDFTDGNDERLYVQGIYEANKGRAGVKLDDVKLPWTTTWHRKEAEEETLKVYRGVKVIEGQAIWVPSATFIEKLKAAGAITSGSSEFSKAYRTARDVVESVVDGVKYAAGMLVGILEGAFEAIKDLFKGALEMVKVVMETVWNLVTGNPGRIKDMVTVWAGKMKQAWEHRGEIADDFLKKWNAPSLWDRGLFQGEVLGWVMMTVLLILVTMGEDAPGAVAAIAGRWPQVVKLVKTVDALGDVTTYLGAAAKATRLPAAAVRKVSKTLGRAEHVVEEGASKTVKGGVKAAEHTEEDMARAISREGKKANKPGMKSAQESLDGVPVVSEFNKLPGKLQGLIRKLEKQGFAKYGIVQKNLLNAEELAAVAQWFGKEIAIVQSPFGSMRVILGTERGILKKDIKFGELVIAHTHPVFRSEASHLALDLQNAGKHIECVVDWSGNVIYFSKAGIKNGAEPLRGTLQPLLGYEAAFMDKAGNIVGFSKIDVFQHATGIRIRARE